MSSLNVGGAASAQWPERDWPASSRKDAVERADSIQRLVDDQRSLGPLATGTAALHQPERRRLTQQDFEVATRLGPNGVTVRSRSTRLVERAQGRPQPVEPGRRPQVGQRLRPHHRLAADRRAQARRRAGGRATTATASRDRRHGRHLGDAAGRDDDLGDRRSSPTSR